MLRFLVISMWFMLLSSYKGCGGDDYVIDFQDRLIQLDGKSNESAWSYCKSYTTFVNPWKEKLDQGTAFKSFHNEEYFFFHFEVVDSLMICHEDDHHDTAVEYSDRVEIFFAKDSLMSEYCGFEFDACGRMQQFYSKGYRSFEKEWAYPGLGKADYQISKHKDGYAIEGRLALKSLREMGFFEEDFINLGVFRADRFGRKNIKSISWISWKDIDTRKPDFHTFQGFRKVEIVKQ